MDEGSAFGRGKLIWTREVHLDEGSAFGRGERVWTRETHLDEGSAFGRGKRIWTGKSAFAIYAHEITQKVLSYQNLYKRCPAFILNWLGFDSFCAKLPIEQADLDEGSAFGRKKRIWTRGARLDEGSAFGRGKRIWTREAHLDGGSAFGRGKRIRTGEAHSDEGSAFGRGKRICYIRPRNNAESSILSKLI